ncbi:MAG: hypothetical protein ACRYG7_45620 [Janthinobacterium lividum]
MRNWVSHLRAYRYRTGLSLVVGCLAAGCSGAHEPAQAPPTPPHATIAATANVPALLGTSIDELRTQLGAMHALPPNFTNLLTRNTTGLLPNKADSLLAFRTGGLTLVASYNVHTRQVRDLFVLGHQEDSLMARASLRVNANGYLLLPVFLANKPNYLVGLRVIQTDTQ